MDDRRASRDGIDRRSFLKYSAVAGAAVSAVPGLGIAGTPNAAAATTASDDSFRWNEATIAELQAAMSSGETTSLGLTRAYIGRIERKDFSGPTSNSVIQLNPDAEAIAAALDDERRAGHVRGPLHGIPIIVKDNVATADKMETTAGSLALLGSKVPRDAGIAGVSGRRAPDLGKANLSSGRTSVRSILERLERSGWPMPDALRPRSQRVRIERGIGSGRAANFAAGTIGTETDGSIVSPARRVGSSGSSRRSASRADREWSRSPTARM